MRGLILALAALVLCTAPYAYAGQPGPWYTTLGFEQPGFVPGPVNNQGNWPMANPPGWIGYGVAGGMAPQVINDPTGANRGQVVEFATTTQGDASGMDILWPSTATSNYVVEIEYDMYRTELNVNNFWWWNPDAGDFTYGLEWDGTQAAHPFGWGPGAGQWPATLRGWDHIAMEWNFRNQTVSSWVNGNVVDNAIPMGANGPKDITGFTFYFGHDGGLGPQTTLAYVDDFNATVLVPEPGAFFVLASGLGMICAGLKRRRT